MNREELNWLLQTIKDAAAARHSTEYATTELPVAIA